MAKQTHSKLIADHTVQIARLKAEVREMRSKRAVINRVATIARRIEKHSRVYVNCGRVYVHVDVRGLQGFKQQRLIRVLEKFERAAGIEFNCTSDYPEGMNRDFSGGNDGLRIIVSAYLTDAPKNCKRVQVRTEHIERPVYELQCA